MSRQPRTTRTPCVAPSSASVIAAPSASGAPELDCDTPHASRRGGSDRDLVARRVVAEGDPEAVPGARDALVEVQHAAAATEAPGSTRCWRGARNGPPLGLERARSVPCPLNPAPRSDRVVCEEGDEKDGTQRTEAPALPRGEGRLRRDPEGRQPAHEIGGRDSSQPPQGRATDRSRRPGADS